MKNYIFVLGIIIMLVLSLTGCSDKSQSPVESSQQGTLEKLIRIDITGFSYPTSSIEPGVVKIVDGNLFLRNRKDYCNIESANSLINATNGIITYNANANALTGEGHFWGTITFTPDAYPELEMRGNWNGQVEMTGPSEWTLTAKLVGHFRGGSTNGMQLFWDAIVTYTDPNAAYWEGNYTGHIQYNDK